MIETKNTKFYEYLKRYYSEYFTNNKHKYKIYLNPSNKNQENSPFVFKKNKNGFSLQNMDYNLVFEDNKALIKYNSENKEMMYLHFLIQNFIFLKSMLSKSNHIFYPVHSSSVEIDNKTYLFSGPSGSGKSTIVKLSGKRILSDDATVLILKQGKPYVLSFPRHTVKKKSKKLYPLKKLFFIKQGKNKISQINYSSALQKLTLNNYFIVTSKFPLFKNMGDNNYLYKKIFKLACILSKKLPCYELSFEKTNEIWQKILDN